MRILPGIVFLALATGCSGGGSGASATPTPSPTPTGTPTFAANIVPLMNAQCGSANNSCHARVAYAATSAQGCRGWLALEDAPLGAQIYGGPNDGTATGCPDRDLYYRLTQITSWECDNPQMPYIDPGNPSNSYLFLKISGGPYCTPPGASSDPMPLGTVLPPSDVEMIRQWILAGAPL